MLRQVGAIMVMGSPAARWGGPPELEAKGIIGSSSDCEWAGVFGPTVKRASIYECRKIRAGRRRRKPETGGETNERAAASMGHGHACARDDAPGSRASLALGQRIWVWVLAFAEIFLRNL